MPMGEMKIEKTRHRKRLVACVAAIAAVLITVLAVLTMRYFQDINVELFEERKSHLIELTDKVSEVIDSVGTSSWNQVDACKHIVTHVDHLETRRELVDALMGTADFIDAETSIAIAIDSDGNYYASDGHTGYWTASEMVALMDADREQAVVEIPHLQGDYFLFIERLAHPTEILETGKRVTHVAVAVDIDSVREEMSVSGFGDECYSYIINADGRRLYEYTYDKNFLDNFNILKSIKEAPIVNGGTYETLQDALQRGESTALEFEYSDGETGVARNWFVANSSIQSTDWQVLLFVPTDVLGAHTNSILKQTMRFFFGLAALLVFLFGSMLYVIVAGRADKRMIAQQEQANALLAEAVEEAQSANRAKSEFLSYMSHDIRTPINGIMGMTDIAVKHIDDRERTLDCLGKIQSSSNHLLSLINDVLTMSRIEAGRTELGHAPFDLRVCLANCASIIEGQISNQDLELVTEFEAMAHPAVIGDELHLRQVFINILGNSVKFTPDGGKIFFRARELRSAEGRAFFHFELEDTGIGMKPEFLPRLFDPFMQEEGGTRTNYKGTGLGMTITKKFMDLMGGTIQVESTLDVGTKFVLELPMEIDAEARTEEAEHAADIDLRGMRVLLVEDNDLNLEIAQVILEEQGVEVTPVKDGQLAVDAFQNNPAGTFDAILMDIMMPVMDGITATKTIRASGRPDAQTVPILAMTANAYDEDVRRTKEAGMNVHMSKPIDPDALLKALDGYYTKARRFKRLGPAGMRALLAEDNDLNFEIMKEALEENGFAVSRAENGQVAVDMVASNPPGTFDAVLMDMHMPVLDGAAATRAIRALDRPDAQAMLILALTADVYAEDAQRAKEAGMNGYLAKPLDVEKLFDALAGAMRE